jgi:nucleoid DNA-binding protein
VSAPRHLHDVGDGTGKVVSYPKRVVPHFTPGKYLKNAANGKRRR